MSERPGTSRLRAGIFMAIVLGLGVSAVHVLAGGPDSPRQEPLSAAGDRSSGADVTTPPTQPVPMVVTVPPTVPTSPPAVPAPPTTLSTPSTRPSSPPATTAVRRPVGSLAAAWIAAGAQGVDPDAISGPATASGSGGPPPVRIDIPAIGVSAPVDPAGLNDDGTLQVPADFIRTNYYTGRPVPGDPGPAIVVGHVDSRRGPAVFYRLRELQPGAEVTVHRADGSSAVFVVERTKQVSKNAFPTDEVYGPTPGPTLRLVTCGGTFDRRSGHYRDNLVVFLEIRS
jgi:hypothetical protein